MKPEIERRKDPALRYLWGMIFDLEEKIKSYEEKQEVFNKELGEIKRRETIKPPIYITER